MLISCQFYTLCKGYLLTFEFSVQIHKCDLKSQITSNNQQSHLNIYGKNDLTFIDLNSSTFMRISVNKWIIIKIHINITCTDTESVCFPGLLKNLGGKHNDNYKY
jgi:hypothetical protein